MHRWKSKGRFKEEKESEEKESAEKVESRDSLCFFPMICGSGGSKSRLAKAAGAEPCGQMRDEKLHAGAEEDLEG